MILIRLRLETPAPLEEQFQNGNLDLYWTLTHLRQDLLSPAENVASAQPNKVRVSLLASGDLQGLCVLPNHLL
jgi:hypothetical protein